MIATVSRGPVSLRVRIPHGSTYEEVDALPMSAIHVLASAATHGVDVSREGAHGFRFRSHNVNILVARCALYLVRASDFAR